MKKTLVYTVSAILMGIVSMLLPALVIFPSEMPTFDVAPASEARAGDLWKGAEVVGVAPFESSLAYAGLIFMFGFLVALGVSQYFKRRIL